MNKRETGLQCSRVHLSFLSLGCLSGVSLVLLKTDPVTAWHLIFTVSSGHVGRGLQKHSELIQLPAKPVAKLPLMSVEAELGQC